MLVYIDDLILTRIYILFLKLLMKWISNQFSIKYLGYPLYFLGVELIPTADGLVLSQHGQVRNFLQFFYMVGEKPTHTLIYTSTLLQLVDKFTQADSKMFHIIIGASQYIILTRLYLSFSINKLSQFMHYPTQIHF